MTTGARVTIGGVTIASSWDGSDLIAVSGLRIRWGRARSPYDDPDPSILTLTLVDRAGTFVSDPARIGQEVTVEMIDPARVMFRGTITVPTAVRARVHNPVEDGDETVWIVTLTASDPLANLGMAVYAGDAPNGSVEGAGGWLEVRPHQRLQRLYDAGASGIVAGFDPLPGIVASPPVDRMMHGQSAADARTALELVQQAYRLHPLGVVGYDPDQNMVKLAQFAASSPVALTLTAGKITLTLTAGTVIPASAVAVADYRLESRVDAAIDAVQVSYWWYGRDPALTPGTTNVKRTIYTQGFIEGRTARYDARTRRVLKIDTEDIIFDPTEFVAGSTDALNRFPAWLLDRVLAIVNKLNGQLRIPQLTFDARRPLPPAIESIIYRPLASAVPIYFAGSVFNGMDGVGPMFQMIGGTLTFDGEWSHEVTMCATGPAVPSTLTLPQLVRPAALTLADFDPALSLADLGLVTIGLP